jgi:hypothetical protein
LIGDTDVIHIPSVFVSRAAYLDLLDMIADTEEGGVWIEIGDGADENAYVLMSSSNGSIS